MQQCSQPSDRTDSSSFSEEVRRFKGCLLDRQAARARRDDLNAIKTVAVNQRHICRPFPFARTASSWANWADSRVLLQGEAHWMSRETQTARCLQCVKSQNNDHRFVMMVITTEHEAVESSSRGELTAERRWSLPIDSEDTKLIFFFAPKNKITKRSEKVTAALHANPIQCWPTKAGRHRLM